MGFIDSFKKIDKKVKMFCCGEEKEYDSYKEFFDDVFRIKTGVCAAILLSGIFVLEYKVRSTSSNDSPYNYVLKKIEKLIETREK